MLTSHWADSSPRLGWKTSRAGDNNAGRLTLVMHGAGEFNYSCSPAARSAPPHCCCPRYRAESSWHRLSRLGLASPAPPPAGLTGSSNSGQAQRTTDTFLQNYQIKTLFSQLYLINVAMKILIEISWQMSLWEHCFIQEIFKVGLDQNDATDQLLEPTVSTRGHQPDPVTTVYFQLINSYEILKWGDCNTTLQPQFLLQISSVLTFVAFLSDCIESLHCVTAG